VNTAKEWARNNFPVCRSALPPESPYLPYPWGRQIGFVLVRSDGAKMQE